MIRISVLLLLAVLIFVKPRFVLTYLERFF